MRSSRTTKSRRKQRGFSLVLVLSVVSFVTVLVIALASHTHVETRVATNAQQLEEARQNALFSLNLALGQLQRHAGPDQRVTGTADLEGSPTNSFWSAVWKRDPAASDSDPHPELLEAWLVSGNESKNLNEPDYAKPSDTIPDPAEENDSVWLLKSPVRTSKQRIKLAKQRIPYTYKDKKSDPKTLGHYAYWIADEGVKANIGLANPYQQSDDIRELIYATTSQATEPSAVSGLDGIERGPATSRILDVSQIPLLANSGSEASRYHRAIREHYHALTGESYGVLSNTRDGGLKIDLSRAFEMSDDEFNEHPIFASGGTGKQNGLGANWGEDFEFAHVYERRFDGGTIVGPTWHLLRDYYRSYRSVNDPFNRPTIGARGFEFNPATESLLNVSDGAEFYSLINANATLIDPRGNSGITPHPTVAPIQPVVTHFSYVISLTRAPAPGGKSRIGVLVEPIITVWNPYNIYLKADALRFDYRFPEFEKSDSGLLFVFERSLSEWDENRTYKLLQEVIGSDGKVYRARVTNLRGENPVGSDKWEYTAEAAARTDGRGPQRWSIEAATPYSEIIQQRFTGVMLSESASAQANGEQINGTPDPIIFKPGEIKVFSTTSKGVNSDYLLAEGYRFNGGAFYDADVRFDFRHPVPRLFPNIDDGYLDVEPGEVIRLTLEPWNSKGKSYGLNERFPNEVAWNISSSEGKDQGNTFKFSLGHYRGGDNQWTSWRGSSDPTFAEIPLVQGSHIHLNQELAPYIFDKGNTESAIRTDPLFVPEDIPVFDEEESSSRVVVAAVDWYLKAEHERFPVRTMANFNPRVASLSDYDGNQGMPATVDNYQIRVRSDINSAFGLVPINSNNRGFWGPSTESNGQSFVPLFQVPTVPLLSLGALQHAHLDPFSNSPAFAIGNSFADPHIPRNQFAHTVSSSKSRTGKQTLVDSSWLLNRELFDRYYFSSITNDLSVSRITSPTEPGPLPNQRMRFYKEPSYSLKSVREELNNSATAAAHLLVDGSFNVNSTSVEAWKAVLGSLKDAKIPYLDPESDQIRNAQDDNAYSIPHAALANAKGAKTSGADAERWRGFRSLTDAQLERLAEEIVKQVRRRGPFLSLSDFVNRRLDNSDLGLSGPLQAAIDKSGINSDFRGETSATALGKVRDLQGGGSFEDPEAFNGATATGAPGFLTQGDLLQMLAPRLTVRSDTFLVRAYGDSINPRTGKVKARAWCEAVIQRVPTPIPLTEAEENLFSRKFKIIRFRWLAPDEV